MNREEMLTETGLFSAFDAREYGEERGYSLYAILLPAWGAGMRDDASLPLEPRRRRRRRKLRRVNAAGTEPQRYRCHRLRCDTSDPETCRRRQRAAIEPCDTCAEGLRLEGWEAERLGNGEVERLGNGEVERPGGGEAASVAQFCRGETAPAAFTPADEDQIP